MKNIIKIIFIVLLIALSTSCSADHSDSDYNELEGYKIEYLDIEMNSVHFTDVESMYKYFDYVVIASPTEVYSEGNQVWNTSTFETADLIYSYTERNFKVHKVFKGENAKIKEITICEESISDGEKIRIIPGTYIARKNNKYLLFLKKANYSNGYYTGHYQGMYDLNADENENNKHIDKELFKKVKEMYKEEFK